MSPRREASRFMEPGPRRDSEDGPTVHLSGGTARRAMTPHCPCPVGSLRHRRRTRSRRTERRGSHPMPEPTPPSAADDRRPQGGPPPPLGPLGSGLGPPGAGAPRAGDQVVPPRPAARLDGNGPRFPGSTSYPSAPTGPDSRPPSSPGPGRDRLPGGRARTGALVRGQDMAQSHRPLLKDGLPRPGGTPLRAHPGEPRSLDCAGPPTCPPSTPR